MIRIGEKLNSSIPSTGELMRRMDADGIAALAVRQADAGADYLDVNAAVFLERETDMLAWAVRAAQRGAAVPVMLDSLNPEALGAALQADCAGSAVVNSVKADKRTIETVAPLLREHGASVVALCMAGGTPPGSAPERLDAAKRALEMLDGQGIPPERVFLDPLVEALSANHRSAAVALDAIRLIHGSCPAAHIVCGVSNVSYGLPGRKAVNAAFLTAALAAGLTAAILDVCDEGLRLASAAAEAIAGNDEYCMDYIRLWKQCNQ